MTESPRSNIEGTPAPDSPGTVLSAISQLLGNNLIPGGSARQQTAGDRVILPPATLGQPYCESALLHARGTENSGIPLRLTAGFLPLGITVTPSSDVICGTPRELGIFKFTTRTDGETILFSLTVAEAVAGEESEQLAILSSQLSVGQVGASYSFQLRAAGGTTPLKWNVIGLPQGLALDNLTGVIGGVPEEEGEFELSVTVTDAAGESTQRILPLTVRHTPVFVTTSQLPSGSIGEPYQIRFQAQGGTPPYSWQLSPPTPLPGLTFNPSSGELIGIPTESYEQTVRIQVTDALEQSDSAALPFIINDSRLTILTTSLQDGFGGSEYSFTLQADGGTPPYQWQSSGAPLPSGLVLSPSGSIQGIPSGAGRSVIKVTVVDSEGRAHSASLSLRIAEVEAKPTPEEKSPAPVEDNTGDTPPPTGPPLGGGQTPEDNELAGVSNFIALPSPSAVGLTWKLPVAQSAGPTNHPVTVLVIRNDERPPQSFDDGKIIYDGSSTNVLANHVLDRGPFTSQTPYYAAYVKHITPAGPELSGATIIEASLSPPPASTQFIDRVVAFSPLDSKCFGCNRVLQAIAGPPQGAGDKAGSSDVVSLGARVKADDTDTGPFGGSITVEFTDNLIFDGPGADFTVFENAFKLAGEDRFFVEPAVVDVSVDGERFYRFPFDFVPHYSPDGSLNLFNPFSYPSGFAGVRPVYSSTGGPSPFNSVLSGGDQFDLATLPGRPLEWIRFIRITAVGDGWLTDINGDLVRHSNAAKTWGASGVGNSGFDLDAIGGLHSVKE